MALFTQCCILHVVQTPGMCHLAPAFVNHPYISYCLLLQVVAVCNGVHYESAAEPFCEPVQAYGEIRSLYTACKPRGFVVLSFYDLRASCLAIHALQGARVGTGNLHISFSTPKDNMGDKDAHQGRPSCLAA